MRTETIRVLVVDDDEDDYFMLRDLLGEVRDRKFNLEWASSYEVGKAAISKKAHDVCFLDYRLGAQTGLDLLKESISEGYKVPIILLTGYGEQDVDLEAMQVGAADYLIKDQINPILLERSIRYSIHRIQTLEALRDREESIRSLLDSTFEGIIVHDLDGMILNVNRVATQIFGYHPTEMIGTLLSAYGMEGNRELFSDIMKSSKVVSFESMGVRKDQSRIHLEISGKPYQHQGHSVRLTTIRDITSRKQMEVQILMQDRLASVGLLASSLAHEIGTPLGVIQGRAEYLAIQTQDNLVVKKNVDVIVSQIDRVSKLIRSLLNLARGDEIHQAGRVQLNQIVEEVLDLMGHELRKHSIAIENKVGKDNPVAVRAESQPLHQVLLNLLVNSVHAIESAVKNGRPQGHFIQLTTEEQGSQRVLSVKDSGCGISEKNLKNLFKPFFTTKDIGVGTGLGLATSYRIIESWGGSIQVESQEGSGTTFKVFLPKV
jgi:PAS domain S-box-containing protein